MTGPTPASHRPIRDAKAPRALRRLWRALPLLLRGYSPYTNPDKFRLLDRAIAACGGQDLVFADLGGIWRVNGAYSRYLLNNRAVGRGFLVDTNIPEGVQRRLTRAGRMELLQGDFGREEVLRWLGPIDLAIFFDVLLHQANPDWDEILRRYASRARCVVIYNQQFAGEGPACRLTDLPLEEYLAVTSDHARTFATEMYRRGAEIHPEHGKPWKDVHHVIQWGITDDALRTTMRALGFTEVHREEYGMFVGLPAFVERGFIFVRG